MSAEGFSLRPSPWNKSSSFNGSGSGQPMSSTSPQSLLSPISPYQVDFRVTEALNARDAVVEHLHIACVSIRQKAALIEQLEKEKAELQETLRSYTNEKEEMARMESMVKNLQDEIKSLKLGRGEPPEYDEVALEQSPNLECGGSSLPASDSLFRTTDDPGERLKARHALLASLPLPTDVPFDILKPIVIPATFSIQDFIGILCNSPLIGNQLGNYRVFQQLTTAWCPEKEEHGYFLTPAFTCVTHPRAVTAHNWAAVDVTTKMAQSTECFYNRDGNWYYAGVYKALRLDDLTTAEWNNLSNETMQTLVKETIAGRRGSAPQNMYETRQQYSAGILKVACVGLQCVGFNNELYRAVLEHAASLTQGTKPKSVFGTTGAGWNVQTTVAQVSVKKDVIASGRREEGKEN